MRKAFIYSFLVLVVLILVWCSGYFYGVLSNERIGINEIRADIQRASENESRAIKQLDSNAARFESSEAKAREVSEGLAEVSRGIADSEMRITHSQDTIRAESSLIEEGSGILKRIKERGSQVEN